MVVRATSVDEYFEMFPVARSVYSGPGFIEVNRSRARAVTAFVGCDSDSGEPRLGIIMGLNADGEWRCPFSAPFGDIAYRRVQGIEHIYDFISDLGHCLSGSRARITLAPAFYDEEMLTRLHGVLANNADRVIWDYNYHYPLHQAADFTAHIDRAARKNLKRAEQAGFKFELTADIDRAYAVIAANRSSHGYPLAMSLEQVKATVQPAGPVQADFFVLSKDGSDVAAAMVYRVTPRVVQVVYWGDAPGYSEHRPMNLLPKLLFEHYLAQGVEITDIGPSSSSGVPSPGLCRFKESIGCRLSLKPTFIWQF